MKTENEMALIHLAYSQWANGYQIGFNEGYVKGWNEAGLFMVLKIFKEFGIDVAVSLSGIPRSVLEEHIDDNR